MQPHEQPVLRVRRCYRHLADQTVGTLVGHAIRPLTAEFCQRAMIKNTISLSWRIGRAVMLANKQGRIGDVGNVVIDALGGFSTGRVLFAGKVIEVTRRVYKGHTVGEVTIAPLSQDDKVEDASDEYDGILKSEKETLDKTDVQYRSRMRTSMPSGCATASRVS